MEDCIFCKIVGGEIPSKKVYENEHVLAFLDINPITRGHTLVIPKEHYKDIFDIPEEVLEKIIAATKKVAKRLYEKLEADGINLQNSNKPAANQVVPHYHMHIIPRYKGDGVYVIHGTNAAEKDFDEIIRKLE